MKKNFSFMAFSTGRESTEGGSVKRYIGVAPVNILAVNPSKEQLEGIYGTTLDKAPEYVGSLDVEGKKVPYARIDFIVKSDPEKCGGIEMVTKVSYFLRKEYRFNKEGTKVQVIDKYGRTAWVTKEQAATYEIPQYANGPANLDKDYRPVYVGEEALTNFIKAFLVIPNVQKYVDGKWIMVDNPSECEARLGEVDKLFNNDFKEVKEIIGYQPNNKVKVLFGVRTTDDGRQFQAAFTEKVLTNATSDYSKLDAELKERKNAGAYPNTEFVVGPLNEYKVEATAIEDLPKGTEAPSSWFK